MDLANLIKGSSTFKLAVSIVVVVPLTVKFPEIVTSAGKPTVTALPSVPDPVTSTSSAVPVIVAT